MLSAMPEAAQSYDRIGVGYHAHRQAEPAWQRAVDSAIGTARSIVNVGAGAGSYEPADRRVIAVEPAATMVAQRPVDAAPALRATAESMPFPSASFDVALAVLTTHHWSDASAGFSELRRVAPRQVVLTWDVEVASRFWLVREYLPEIAEHEAGLATLDAAKEHLEVTAVRTLPVPSSCADGVLAAYWRRPEVYLDATVRAAISGISLLDGSLVDAAMARLAADLEDGTWTSRHGDLAMLDEIDAGYRLVIAGTRQ